MKTEVTVHPPGAGGKTGRAPAPDFGASAPAAGVEASGGWADEARCRGRVALMYDSRRSQEALALCGVCPVAQVCLWSAMVGEAGDPYRYGLAGGLGQARRRRLSETMSPDEVAARFELALGAWERGEHAGTTPPGRPVVPAYRRRRRCRGCEAIVRQPRAGRPQEWCSSACRQRATVDRAEAASAQRRRWTALPEEAKERKRAAMRQRWSTLDAEARADLAARRRTRRAMRRQAA